MHDCSVQYTLCKEKLELNFDVIMCSTLDDADLIIIIYNYCGERII